MFILVPICILKPAGVDFGSEYFFKTCKRYFRLNFFCLMSINVKVGLVIYPQRDIQTSALVIDIILTLSK